ncbi:MAG: hypothetical protein V2J10_01440 [Wenzhouxiangella sp.]|jgi:hypothetical protein|nr:hypothetical protein [Wenzhouxiangella sp.]
MTRLSRWTLLGFLLLLSGCQALPESTAPDPGEDEDASILFEIGRVLPGEYSTAVLRQDGATGGDPLRLSVLIEPGGQADRVQFRLIQQQGSGPARYFRLGFDAMPDSPGLAGFFAPSDASGQIQRSCALRVSVRSDGFTAWTDPGECRFGEETGLLKEIDFDGRRLMIGDRLVRLDDAASRGTDQVHTFYPVHVYAGWAGKRAEGDWLRAERFRIHSAGGALALVDAAGMSLGVSLQLTPYRLSVEEAPLLRLQAYDSESGEVIAESWSDPGTRTLGLAVPDLQVGLQRTAPGTTATRPTP